MEQKTLRLGAAIVILAVVIRLVSNGFFAAAVNKLIRPETACVLLFLETGRVVRPQAATTPQTEPEATQPQKTAATFSEEDAALVQVNSVCGYEVDLGAMLTAPLDLSLRGEEPTVLILHSHATESYTPTETYQESSPYRTLDEGYNVVSVGAHLAQILEENGVRVIHDKTLHDHPSYSDAYGWARETIAGYLEQYPSIRLVLDIHRDSVEGADGKQLRYTAQVPQGTAARVMMVVGTDASGLSHPDWQENMALAVKLHAQLEKEAPGITRPISFRSQRFNQDQSPGAMLLEMGSAGNTRQEALLAAEITAHAILTLSD